MADLDLTQVSDFFNKMNPDQVVKVLDELQNKSATFSKALKTSFSDASLAVSKNTEAIAASSKEIKDYISDLNKLSVSALLGTLDSVIRKLAQANPAITGLAAQAGLLGAGLLRLPEPKGLVAIGTAAQESTLHVSETLETINKLFNLDPKSNPFIALTENLIRMADPAEQFENGLIMQAAASGELGELLLEVGDNLEGMEGKMVTFANLTNEVANVSGLSSTKVSEYASKLNAIPGALSMTIVASDGTAGEMHLLDAAIKVATGTGQNFTDVFNQMNDVYREFGTTGKDALEYITRLSSTSQGLKMPLDLVRTYTENASKSFRFFGDNTQSALSILERFGPALQDSGLGPKAISDLVQNVTQNISQLGIANKAFLAGQTGGMNNGLQGSYQIDLLMKQGKTDEVYSKVEASLRKQFGGRIVTLEEAAKDSRAAGQFTKQIQLLTSGPTKIANSEGEAQRILEVFAKGKGSGSEAFKTPADSFKDAVSVGNEIQTRQFNQLVVLSNWAEKNAIFSAITANNLARVTLGTEGIFKQPIEATRAVDSADAAQRKMIIGQGADSTIEPTVKEEMVNSLSQFDSFESIGKFLGTSSDSIRQMFKSKSEELGISQSISQTATSPVGPTSRVSSSITDQYPDIHQQHQQAAGNVAQAINQANGGTSIIKVMTMCAECDKKIAEEASLRVVNGRIEEEKQKNISMDLGSY